MGCHELGGHHFWTHLFGTCFAAPVARDEMLVQVGQRQDVSPLHDQTSGAVGLGKSIFAPTSHAWDLASGWVRLVGPISQDVEDKVKEISQYLTLMWSIHHSVAMCSGEETT